MIENAIRFFHANEDNDQALFQVFRLLATEIVFLPVNQAGNLLSLQMGNNEVIPIFTSESSAPQNEPIGLRQSYLKDYVNTLISAKKHLIVNPFSEEAIRFLIPYEALHMFLLPIIEES
ncbi:MAG: SseB family protein [Lachnospiraceae bacterium]|nr:SseB family protein [Lachnospiraceae bacterium]